MMAKTPREGHYEQGDESLSPVSILIVDDEPRNLTVLESILTDPAYRLVRAGSGEEALLTLVTQEFAVLILDVQMPGMSGFELAQIIKQRRRTASVPIIFLTAYFNDDRHMAEGYGAGAVDYLQKPLNPAVLRSKVAVFSDLHRKTQRLAEEVAERRRAQASLSALNSTLDQRVAERTQALVRSEARLREVNDKKDEFLATLAHELRNPLAPIRNAVEIVKARSAGDAELKWASGIIDRQVRTMGRLIEDLMDVSRVNSGRFELRRELVDLRAIVDEALEVAKPLIHECAHELQVRKAPHPLLINADRARIAQALVNLLANAAKYTDRGGCITLSCGLSGCEATVTVRDTGIGIAPSRLRKVFEMFSQEDPAIERARGGIGIGLALTRRLVEMHTGVITAKSEGAGRGSEFTIRLPLAQRQVVESTPQEQPLVAGETPTLRIVVADDNLDAASTLAALLELQGHAVVQVNDGEAAVSAVAGFDPDLVLLDIGMPKLNGYEACRGIRSLPGNRPRTIAAISGWGQAQDLDRSKVAGFDQHLIKPIEVLALDRLVLQAGAQRDGSKAASQASVMSRNEIATSGNNRSAVTAES